jgi:CheY-like chemotaxis protein
MSITTLLVAAARRTPTPDHEPVPSPLARVQQAARGITSRVRQALLPAESEFPPLRALVVDDHPDAADTLAAVLELLDCPTLACTDGPTALAAAADFRPQVCLLDLAMPRMDGLELARRLREQAGGRAMLLVAVTALGDLEARTQTALAGFHAHVTKPVDTPTLIDLLARLGERLARPGEPPTGGDSGGGATGHATVGHRTSGSRSDSGRANR